MKLPTERTEPRLNSFLLKLDFLSLPAALQDMVSSLTDVQLRQGCCEEREPSHCVLAAASSPNM